MAEQFTPPNADISLWQAAAVALCEEACGYEKGRNKLEPRYVEVTEHRDGPGPTQRENYSSCGDQPHWMLERLGLREWWMNRASLKQYSDGQNIIQLGVFDAKRRIGCPISIATPTDPNWRPEPGDIGLIWTTGLDAHALVFLGPGSDAKHVRTANYGAGGMSPAITPGAELADSPFERSGAGWLVGKSRRRLNRIIRLRDAVKLVKAQPDLTGARVTDELNHALGAKYWSE